MCVCCIDHVLCGLSGPTHGVVYLGLDCAISGAVTSGACHLCLAGTYQTGSSTHGADALRSPWAMSTCSMCHLDNFNNEMVSASNATQYALKKSSFPHMSNYVCPLSLFIRASFSPQYRLLSDWFTGDCFHFSSMKRSLPIYLVPRDRPVF